MKIDPQAPRINNNRELVLSKFGRYLESVTAFEKDGDEASAFNNFGCIYMIQEKHMEAIEAFQKAIEIKLEFLAIAYENIKKVKAGLNSERGRKNNLSR